MRSNLERPAGKIHLSVCCWQTLAPVRGTPRRMAGSMLMAGRTTAGLALSRDCFGIDEHAGEPTTEFDRSLRHLHHIGRGDREMTCSAALALNFSVVASFGFTAVVSARLLWDGSAAPVRNLYRAQASEPDRHAFARLVSTTLVPWSRRWMISQFRWRPWQMRFQRSLLALGHRGGLW